MRITKAAQIAVQSRNKMMGWFFIASFQGLHGSKINTRIQSDIEVIENSGKGFPLNELFSKMRKEDVPTTIRKGDLTDYYQDVFRNNAYAMLLNVIFFVAKQLIGLVRQLQVSQKMQFIISSQGSTSEVLVSKIRVK
jgi:hypothetical protein